MCNGLDAISSGGVSTVTGFPSVAKSDLHSATLVVKRTNKRCCDCYVLERHRFVGTVSWGWVEKAIGCNVFFALSFLKGVDILS